MNHHSNSRIASRTWVGPRDGSSLIEVVVATLMVATLLAQEAMERTATAP